MCLRRHVALVRILLTVQIPHLVRQTSRVSVSECLIWALVHENRWFFGNEGFWFRVQTVTTSQTAAAVDPLGWSENDSTAWCRHGWGPRW